MRRALRTLRGYRMGQLAARAGNRSARRLPWSLGVPAIAPPLDATAVARHGASAREQLGGAAHGQGPGDPWDPPEEQPALAAFVAHYHRWLVPLLDGEAADRERAWSLLAAWLEAFPPTRPALALSWHPYVISTRVRAWTAVLGAGPPAPLAHALALALWQGLAVLDAHPERDVAGNHELRNATALAAGAALFAGPEAERLERRGRQRAEVLVGDQIGPDGGHVERSTAYQAEVIGDLLDLLEATERTHDDVPSIVDAAEAALGWQAQLAPPSVDRPELNDANEDIGAPTADLLARAAGLGLRATYGGAARLAPRYVVLGDARTRLVVDCDQPTRPDLPYHAHADSLAVYLALDGVGLIVDRGVATYEAGAERAWWRSTAAHSTVVPAGGDTSELLGAFRAGRLARTELLADEPSSVAARHDGAGRPERAHARRVRQDGPAAWTIWDAPAAPAGAVARFQLPPGATVEVDGGAVRVAHRDRRLWLRFEGAGEIALRDTPHALGFGRAVPALTIDVRLADRVLVSRLEAGE